MSIGVIFTIIGIIMLLVALFGEFFVLGIVGLFFSILGFALIKAFPPRKPEENKPQPSMVRARYSESTDGFGRYNVDIVGESNYQPALEAICGKPSERGYQIEKTARLIHEDSNPYDNQAMKIEIDGRHVGYLSRDNARGYRAQLRQQGFGGRDTTCPALISGGWDKGNGDTGKFGVRLELSKAKEEK
jgi:hypothetical protein